jgi:hypothetical protein
MRTIKQDTDCQFTHHDVIRTWVSVEKKGWWGGELMWRGDLWKSFGAKYPLLL